MSSLAHASEEEFSRSWSWETDGDNITGRFLKFGEGFTANGMRPFVILELESGEQVTVWLFHQALLSKFSSEVHRRPSGDLTPGERVVIQRGEMKESGNRRQYRSYRVVFSEAPARSARAILGEPDELDMESQAPLFRPVEEGEVAPDDDVPF